MSKVIVYDSSGLVSLVKEDDKLHEHAAKVVASLGQIDYQILLPYEVLAETLNVIGKLVGKQQAWQLGSTLLAQHNKGSITFVASQPYIINDALLKLKSATGSPSFIDCLVMAHADHQQTSYVFGFDATFKKNGYRLPG